MEPTNYSTTSADPAEPVDQAAVRVVDHDARWRPYAPDGPPCPARFRDTRCGKRGAHYCAPRADRVIAFFAELLVHIKGPLRRTPFRPRHWQEHKILRPLFGEAVWSHEWQCYVRRFRRAHIVMARKNGKSEIAAGILLYLLIGDGEDSAEVYSAAKDKDQAAKVFGPAARMVELSPRLRARLKETKNDQRLYDAKTGSVYTTITGDASGELGHNPHGFNLDELLAQPDGSLWDAMDTADGTRLQELLFTTTTETNEPISFGAEMIDEAERIQEDPARAPHVFAFVRKLPITDEQLARLQATFPDDPDLPVSTDPFDERNWKWSCPALDEFLSRESMRRAALEARNDKRKEAAFRQFRCNQRQSSAFRWISVELWNANTGEPAPDPLWIERQMEGRKCWGGLDLSSKLDLTAWCLLFDSGQVSWRFWVPESVTPVLDEHTGGNFSKWVEAGWITETDGDTIDYDQIYDDIAYDAALYTIVDVTYDKWSGEPVRQAIVKRTGLTLIESNTTYERMTPPMTEAMRRLKAGEYVHHGNPVARWMADGLVAKHPTDDPDRIRPVKPNRDKVGKRIDGMPALFFATDGAMRGGPIESVYESRGIASL
ncbi:MAG TPA: terminase TerL endonuclease subunit [Actinokineospora sp.]|nr:terminase TerL endonuclease subunit [Actinokineospora sp.]